jgi:hypothetical protein
MKARRAPPARKFFESRRKKTPELVLHALSAGIAGLRGLEMLVYLRGEIAKKHGTDCAPAS